MATNLENCLDLPQADEDLNQGSVPLIGLPQKAPPLLPSRIAAPALFKNDELEDTCYNHTASTTGSKSQTSRGMSSEATHSSYSTCSSAPTDSPHLRPRAEPRRRAPKAGFGETSLLLAHMGAVTNTDPPHYDLDVEATQPGLAIRLLNPSRQESTTQTTDSEITPTKNLSHASSVQCLSIKPSENEGNVSSTAEISSPSSDTSTADSHGNSEDSDKKDDDYDLEAAADEALREWFGISLDRLRDPWKSQVLDTYGDVRSAFVGILEDEGHQYHTWDSNSHHEDQEPLDTHTASPSIGQARDGGITSQKVEASGSGNMGKGKRKAKSDGGCCDSDNTSDFNDESDSDVPAERRRKRRRRQYHFSCPFRKRNATRFNVGNHEKCANRSFSSITDVKKHICAWHYKKDRSVASSNPEDGIDKKTWKKLKERKKLTKILDWDPLWRLLFPADTSVPSSHFEPVIENHQVKSNFNTMKASFDADYMLLLSQELRGILPQEYLQKLSWKVSRLEQEHFQKSLDSAVSVDTQTSRASGTAAASQFAIAPEGAPISNAVEARETHDLETMEPPARSSVVLDSGQYAMVSMDGSVRGGFNQEMLQQEGVMIETDPFMGDLGSFGASGFDDLTGWDDLSQAGDYPHFALQ